MTSRRIGLARALSKIGYCSRSRAFALIRAGKVAINGNVTRNPESPIIEGKDRITVEGQPIEATEKIYLLLNKPRGIVTTASDEQGRETVYSLLPKDLPWIAPVGRLDKASEGLLLLTNDSEWAAHITAPEAHLDKTYHVQIGTVAHDLLLATLTAGVHHDGEPLRVKHASILGGGAKNTWLEIVLDEGRNRQIRRIFDAVAIEVLRLVRVSVGPINLGTLPKGQTRRLTAAEKDSMDAQLSAAREHR